MSDVRITLLEALQDTSAVHGAACLSLDGKRKFLVINHASRLAVYAADGGVGRKDYEAIADVRAGCDIRHCCAVEWSALCRGDSTPIDRCADLMLTLQMDDDARAGRHTWSLLRWNGERKDFTRVCSATVDDGETLGMNSCDTMSRLRGSPIVSASKVARDARGRIGHLTAYQMFRGRLGIVEVKPSSPGGEPTLRVHTMAMDVRPSRAFRPSNEDADDGEESHAAHASNSSWACDEEVVHLEIVLAGGSNDYDFEGSLLLSVICSDSHVQGGDMTIVCMCANFRQSVVKPGPFGLRNVAPSTSLVCSSKGVDGGVDILAFSSESIVRIKSAGQGFSQPMKYVANMVGMPSAVVPFKERQYLVADTTGCLYHVLVERDECIVKETRLRGNLHSPSVLMVRFLAEGGGDEFDIIMGGPYGSTQATQCKMNHTGQVVIGECKLRIANDGPVLDAVAFRETNYLEDQMLMARNVASESVIQKVSYGAALEPQFEVPGLRIPGVPSIMFVCSGSKSGGSATSFVIFSFEGADVTQIYDVSTKMLRPRTISGFHHEAHTLAASFLDDGTNLIQVTRRELRIVDVKGSRFASTYPAKEYQFDLAEADCGRIVTASGCKLSLFEAKSKSFEVAYLSGTELEEDISALRSKRVKIAGNDHTIIFVGQWFSNEVVVLDFASMQHLLCIDTIPAQPRSFLVSSIGASSFLFVGSNDGRVYYYPFSLEDGSLCIEVEDENCIRISNSHVDLYDVGGSKIYAKSDIDAVIQENVVFNGMRAHLSAQDPFVGEQEAVDSSVFALRATRVCGSCRVLSVAPVVSSALGLGLMWYDAKEEIHFGTLDHRPQIHTESVRVGDTVQTLAYHHTSHCVVGVGEGKNGRTFFHVVDVDAMERRLCFPLHANHFFTCLGVAQLPYHSIIHRRQGSLEVVSRKEFILMASVVHQDASITSTGVYEPCRARGLLSVYGVGMSREGLPAGTSLDLMGSHAIQDACNAISATNIGTSLERMDAGTPTEDGTVLALGCQRSIMLVQIKVVDKLARLREEASESIEELASIPCPKLAGPSSAEEEGGGTQGEHSHSHSEGSKASDRKQLSEVRVVDRRTMRDAVLDVCVNARNEVLCSDIRGRVLIFGITASQDGIQLYPLTRFESSADIISAPTFLDEKFVSFADGRASVVLERQTHEEEACRLQFDKLCKQAFEDGHPIPHRSEYGGEEEEEGERAGERAGERGGEAAPNTGAGEEDNARPSESNDALVVPAMHAVASHRLDGCLVASAVADLDMGQAQRQQEMKGDVLCGDPLFMRRRVRVTSDGRIWHARAMSTQVSAPLLSLQAKLSGASTATATAEVIPMAVGGPSMGGQECDSVCKHSDGDVIETSRIMSDIASSPAMQKPEHREAIKAVLLL